MNLQQLTQSLSKAVAAAVNVRMCMLGRLMLGRVKWFDAKKGFGFIAPTDGGPEIFVHHSQISMDGYRQLCENQEVSYESSVNGSGKSQAINVKPMSPFRDTPKKATHEKASR